MSNLTYEEHACIVAIKYSPRILYDFTINRFTFNIRRTNLYNKRRSYEVLNKLIDNCVSTMKSLHLMKNKSISKGNE